MAYLVFDNELDAADRSRMAWEDRLGRPKNLGDITEFLNSWFVGLDGKVALDTNGMGLKGTEETKIIATLDSSNWPESSMIVAAEELL